MNLEEPMHKVKFKILFFLFYIVKWHIYSYKNHQDYWDKNISSINEKIKMPKYLYCFIPFVSKFGKYSWKNKHDVTNNS